MNFYSKKLKEKKFTSLDLANLPRIMWVNLDKIKTDDSFWKNQIYFKLLFGLDIKKYVERFRDCLTGDLVIRYI